jgi:hypothetical protein
VPSHVRKRSAAAALAIAATAATFGATGVGSAASSPTLGVKWGSYQNGYGHVHPSHIYNGGDPTGEVRNVRWTGWGRKKASGRGNGFYVPSDRAVYQGYSAPARVVAWGLTRCHGHRAYSKIAWYFPGKGEHFNPHSYINICTGDYVGF